MTDIRLVLVTVPDEETAEQLSRVLLDERRIACANIVPGIRSLYRWEGAVEDTIESLLILKAPAAGISALLGRIPELHPYDVPEVLVMRVDMGHEPYLSWVIRETGSEESR